MIRKFEELEDVNDGKTAFICGHGPSLNSQRQLIEEKCEGDSFSRISINNWWNFFEEPPDYHFICNPLYTMKLVAAASDFYKKPCSPIVCASSYMNRPPCDYVAPEYSDWDIFTYPFGEFRDIVSAKFPEGDTRQVGPWISAIFLAIDFAFFTGFNKIILSGIDLDWRKGYADPIRPHFLPHSIRINEQGKIDAVYPWDDPVPGSKRFPTEMATIPTKKFVDRAKMYGVEFGTLGGTEQPWWAEMSGVPILDL
jgi:hypothetical protein